MRNSVIMLTILLATSMAGFARKDESLEQLIARAESARLEDRPAICTEIAQRQVESAGQLYTAGKVDEARAAVEDVVKYSDKASDAAARTGKKLKDTEIALRKMAAADRLEQMRTELLSHMFGKKGDK
jgi:hypothetical protein